MHVSYQSNLYVVEGAFLLEFMPLLLEDVECLRHGKLLQEVTNKIIDNNVSVERLWLNISNSSHLGASCLSSCHLLEISLGLQSCEIIKIIIIFSEGLKWKVFYWLFI